MKVSPAQKESTAKGDTALMLATFAHQLSYAMARLLAALGLPEPPPYDPADDPLLQAAERPRAGEREGAAWRIQSE